LIHMSARVSILLIFCPMGKAARPLQWKARNPKILMENLNIRNRKVDLDHESKAFQDISTYFSKEEWEKLTNWQKSLYVYMKRNYIRMISLGSCSWVEVNKPVFMRWKDETKESLVERAEVHGTKRDGHFKWISSMQQRKRPKLSSSKIDYRWIYSQRGLIINLQSEVFIGDTGGNIHVNVWAHRLRERKTRVIYEEISDPEEEDDDDDDDD
ncbi:Synovial sarcoma, X member B, breakpoint 1, partial [Sigmodon hispidus]